MDRLVQFYVQRSKVTEEQLRGMLTRDSWLDAEATIEHGFVDEILA